MSWSESERSEQPGMTSFFNVGALGGNPFSTPVGQRIGKFMKIFL